MKAFRFLIGFLLCVGFVQCTQKDPDIGIGPFMEITQFAGTNPSKDWNFLPYPAHFGKFKDYPTFLLTRANHPGSQRSVVPIGMIMFEADENEFSWLIVNDANPDFQIAGLHDMKDLMTTHNGIKSTLERWIVNHNGIGGVKLKGWDEIPSDMKSDN